MTQLILADGYMAALHNGRTLPIQRVNAADRYAGLIKFGWKPSVVLAVMAGLVTLKDTGA